MIFRSIWPLFFYIINQKRNDVMEHRPPSTHRYKTPLILVKHTVYQPSKQCVGVGFCIKGERCCRGKINRKCGFLIVVVLFGNALWLVLWWFLSVPVSVYYSERSHWVSKTYWFFALYCMKFDKLLRFFQTVSYIRKELSILISLTPCITTHVGCLLSVTWGVCKYSLKRTKWWVNFRYLL